MNTYSHIKKLTALALISAVVFVNVSFAQTKDNLSAEHELPQLVNNVLLDTEQAIAMLRIDRDQSLDLVNQALATIKTLESSFSVNTITNSEKGNTHSHNHFYPKVDLTELQKDQTLPTLTYKLESDILYQGTDKGDSAFFDYTFAKASLVTAKDAIKVDHDLEAMSNLRRVFEAIYLTPEFEVTDQPLS